MELIIISGLEYLKYVTEQVTMHFDLPTEDKKKKKHLEKKPQPYYSNHWFGVIPFSIKSYFKKIR